MNDMIYRQEALDTLRKLARNYFSVYDKRYTIFLEALLKVDEAIRELPSAEPEQKLHDVPDTNVGDMISRQAAIKAIEDLQDCYNGFSDTYDKACIIGALEEVPSAQQRWKPDEWCTDCSEYDHERNCCPRFNRVIRKTLEEQQEWKTGKWRIGTIPPSVGTHCDNCGWAWADHIDAVKLNKTLSLIKTRYCPNCGARMEDDNGN